MDSCRVFRVWRALCTALVCALAPMAQAQNATALHARHAGLSAALAHNAFGRALVLESSEATGHLNGDIYARVDQPFARLSGAMQSVGQWCDILILHLNVKQCRPVNGDSLALVVGSKHDQPLADAYRFDFTYRVAAREAGYLRLVLGADEGPLGTSSYRIVLEAAPIDSRRSFLHLSYAYEQGMAARLAMQGYLATGGRGKVGFSVVGRQADGSPIFVRDLRGVIERNTMRYYLAIEAYLGALDLPPAQQLAKRLNDWHSGVERYPRQLHELERDEYLELKRVQVERQKNQMPHQAHRAADGCLPDIQAQEDRPCEQLSDARVKAPVIR
jgi:hypothetical protein